MTKKHKIKRYLVHKLGGLMLSDMPIPLRQQYLLWLADRTLDKIAHDQLENSFKPDIRV